MPDKGNEESNQGPADREDGQGARSAGSVRRRGDAAPRRGARRQQELGAEVDDRRHAARPRPRRIPARDARRGAGAGVRQPPAGAPGPRPARRQAARPSAGLRAGRRIGARGEPGALAQRQDGHELDRVDEEARLPRLRGSARGPDPPRGRPARADPDLDIEARARPQGPPAHPRHAAVGDGPRPRRPQRGRGSHRRRAARDAGRRGALPGAALRGGGAGC